MPDGFRTTGDLTLTAGERVVLRDGFSVEAGGTLTAGVDGSLATTGEAHWAGVYDRFGNLTEQTTTDPGGSPVTRSIGTNSATNRLTTATYDEAGNLLAWGSESYVYDPFYMLSEAPDRKYIYGPGDERIWEVDFSEGTAGSDWHERWSLRGPDALVLRRFTTDGGNESGNWAVDTDYVCRDGRLLAAETSSGTRHFHGKPSYDLAALELHVQGLLEEGLPVPEPEAVAEYMAVR